MLKNDTLKNGTSRIGLYGSAPRVLQCVHLFLSVTVSHIYCFKWVVFCIENLLVSGQQRKSQCRQVFNLKYLLCSAELNPEHCHALSFEYLQETFEALRFYIHLVTENLLMVGTFRLQWTWRVDTSPSRDWGYHLVFHWLSASRTLSTSPLPNVESEAHPIVFMQWKSAYQYENSCKTSKRHTASVLVGLAGQGSSRQLWNLYKTGIFS